MRTSTLLAATAAFGLAASHAGAATIAKAHVRHHTKAPAAQPEDAPAPAEAAPPKVIEPDPVYFGHAGSGTKY